MIWLFHYRPHKDHIIRTLHKTQEMKLLIERIAQMQADLEYQNQGMAIIFRGVHIKGGPNKRAPI